MSDYPSDLGHWERINESASTVMADKPLNLPLIMQDLCRALLDLLDIHREIREAKAEAWNEGKAAGLRQSDWEHGDTAAMYVATNPYRIEAGESDD